MFHGPFHGPDYGRAGDMLDVHSTNPPSTSNRTSYKLRPRMVEDVGCRSSLLEGFIYKLSHEISQNMAVLKKYIRKGALGVHTFRGHASAMAGLAYGLGPIKTAQPLFNLPQITRPNQNQPFHSSVYSKLRGVLLFPGSQTAIAQRYIRKRERDSFKARSVSRTKI
ncbi:hypothetical protein SODALDRAFT_132153 [Sodiomyces alkalinus F11]|uniref:Uncharacterized protein n=1 Tax=Sodiomyces alkalinus (strain CBS 110278 / VKM F-3762 / F11) TaxID=1314773 RepID=A0A3N2PYC3_SODAK|nr:hypothetical protein SODALDRAFT_132153 [Sodiomyces alkalinus F11]ROT39539.1 hypothetical protein SODALDRAFT_132153 [Sodiomyces alkalinus F11]